MRIAMVDIEGAMRTLVLDSRRMARDVTAVTGSVTADVDIDAFAALTRDTLSRCPEVALDDTIRWLPPVLEPRRILCVGFNYRSHATETNHATPRFPTFFIRFPSSLVGHGQPIERTDASDTLDWEGEIAVVIGRGGRNILASEALKHVWGYTAFADNSIREFQSHGTQATAGKNFDRSGSFGPWLVTADEVPDPNELEVLTYLDGVQMQHGSLKDLIFDIPAIIEYVSSWTALSPGDVIATGTPQGIGHRKSPPRYLQAGETLTVDIPGLTQLVNNVV